MKKVSIKHNSDTILTGRLTSGASIYFPPGVDTVVDSEAEADAIIYDFNAQSPYKMEKVVEEVEE